MKVLALKLMIAMCIFSSVILVFNFPYIPTRLNNINNASSTYAVSQIGSNNVSSLNTIYESAIGATIPNSQLSFAVSSAEYPTDGTPVVANNIAYVGSRTGTLFAFDATGSGSTCSYGSPSTCTPLWTATPNPNLPIVTTPVVSNNLLIVSVGNTIYVYDATGTTNCSGTPMVCTPLWTAVSPLPSSAFSSPLVSNGYIYVNDAAALYAFSANGSTDCTGTPVVCSPEWTENFGLDSLGTTVSGNIVYTVGTSIYAYDANGSIGCSGVPVICNPIKQYSDSNSNTQFISPVTVSSGFIYGVTPNGLDVFNTASSAKCNSINSTCTPNFTDPISTHYSTVFTPPTPLVVSDVVFVDGDSGYIYAFSSNGTSNCSGTPLVCKPLVSKLLDSRITSTPVADNSGDSIFATTINGNFYDLGEDNYMFTNTGSVISNITVSPLNMNVQFNPSNTDYSLYCTSLINPVTVTISSTTGNLDVAGTSASSITLNISLTPNQAFAISSPNPNPRFGLQQNTQYWIRCLPPGFPTYTVYKPGHVASGYYLINSVYTNGATDYYLILNKYGSPVWYQQVPKNVTPNLFKLTSPDTILTSGYSASLSQNKAFSFYNLDSGAINNLYAPSGIIDSHDYVTDSSGDHFIASDFIKTANYSALGYSVNQSYIDNVIQEISPSGNLIWQWDPANYICPDESDNYISLGIGGTPLIDPLHLNSISLSPDGNNLLVSFRNLSAVYDINIQTGKILWKLGGNSTTCDGEQHLSIVNDPESTISAQHDAKFVSNNEITMYDDHTAMTGASRGIEYAIDTTSGTATMVWEYLNPSGTPAIMTGSLYRYDNENDNLICWGATSTPGYSEVNANGTVLERVTFLDGFNGYRAYKYPTSAISLTLLRDTAGQTNYSSTTPTPNAGNTPPHLISDNGYTSLMPKRIVDTRPNSGYFGQGQTLNAGGSLTIPVATLGAIPAEATAVEVNITATNTTQSSFLSANPGNIVTQGSSIVNWSQANSTVANLVSIPIGSNGDITVINKFGSTDVIVDLEGYWGYSAPGSGLLTPIPQSRLVDTRSNSGYSYEGQPLNSNGILTVQATGNLLVPSTGVTAVILNVTAISSGPSNGFLTVFPAAPVLNNSQIIPPIASNLNWTQSEVISNQVIVPVGPTGAIDIYNSNGSTNVVIDVEGYFSDGSNQLFAGSEITPMAARRIIDTRNSSGYLFAGMSLAPGSSITFSPASILQVGNTQLTAILMNLTVTDISSPGWVSVTPNSSPASPSSNVNFSSPGDTVADSVLASTGINGAIQITNHSSSSLDIVVDLEGYFIPNLQ